MASAIITLTDAGDGMDIHLRAEPALGAVDNSTAHAVAINAVETLLAYSDPMARIRDLEQQVAALLERLGGREFDH
ncbi:hypothetical protein ABWL39_20445 [Chitinivorax sp. PXF-14]|uniref:hypothetical protein n=1 Tax=Chitinivorax sp. PXF-14 TaxID=3230488 RepID=UPI00346635FE